MYFCFFQSSFFAPRRKCLFPMVLWSQKKSPRMPGLVTPWRPLQTSTTTASLTCWWGPRWRMITEEPFISTTETVFTSCTITSRYPSFAYIYIFVRCISRCNQTDFGFLPLGFLQRISGASISPSIQYFGRSVSARLDLDGDELIDLAVGAQGSAVMLRWVEAQIGREGESDGDWENIFSFSSCRFTM